MNIFKIVLPGNSVRNASLKDEVLDSRYPSPKVSTVAQPPHAGIISVNWQTTTPLPSGTNRVIYTQPHGYTQVPTVIASFTYDNGTNIAKGILPLFVGAIATILIDSDSTNVSLRYLSTDIASTPIPPFLLKVRFYVFAERGLE